MSTESIDIDDKRDFSLARQIHADPRATALAVELLDRIAGPEMASKDEDDRRVH